MKKKENKMENIKIKCEICPRECLLKEGQAGFCRVRRNIKGEIKSEVYGYTTGLCIDPIEKKPLYHFYPGSEVLSFGTFGCNMGCIFCQNHHMSKHDQDYSLTYKAKPEYIVETAKKYKCKSVAFTYNDPVVYIEYAVDTAKLCQREGIKTVAVTAGYINPKPREKLFENMDAVNIDLKGFTENFYKRNCYAKIGPVLDTIKYAVRETNCEVEITTLLIDGENTDTEILKREYEWIITNVGEEIPLHLSGFHPDYRMKNKEKTRYETLIRAYRAGKEIGLKNVYTGNIVDTETSATYCPNCGEKMIERKGKEIEIINMKEGKCNKCGSTIYGSFK